MSYLNEWKSAQKRYETTFKACDPGKKFIAQFKKCSTSIEKAAKSADTAINKKDAKALALAANTIQQELYTLMDVQVDDKAADKRRKHMLGDLKTLINELEAEQISPVSAGDIKTKIAILDTTLAGSQQTIAHVEASHKKLQKKYMEMAKLVQIANGSKWSAKDLAATKKMILDAVKMTPVLKSQRKAAFAKVNGFLKKTGGILDDLEKLKQSDKSLNIDLSKYQAFEKHSAQLGDDGPITIDIEETCDLVEKLPKMLQDARSAKLDQIKALVDKVAGFTNLQGKKLTAIYNILNTSETRLSQMKKLLADKANRDKNIETARSEIARIIKDIGECQKTIKKINAEDFVKNGATYVKLLNSYGEKQASMAVAGFANELRDREARLQKCTDRLNEIIKML